MDKYNVSLRIEDANSKRVKQWKGFDTTDIKYNVTAKDYAELERKMLSIHNTFQRILPNDYKIRLSAMVYNSISDTWMTMASYYGCEKRFVKH